MKNPLEIADLLQFRNYSTLERLPNISGFQNGLSGIGYPTREIRFIRIARAVRFKRAHLDRFLLDNVHGKEVKSDS
jgi:hypothetical protein